LPKRKDDFLTEIEEVVVEKLKKADLKEIGRFVIEEALYIALMSDLFLVSGRMKVFNSNDDQTPGNWTPLYAQRQVIGDIIIAMRKISCFELPFPTGASWTGITFDDVAPLGWATALLESWDRELHKAETVGDTVYAPALPSHMRMFMVLGLPGMLRIAVQLTRQLIQIAT